MDVRQAYAPHPLPERFPHCADHGLLPDAVVPDGTPAPVLRRLWAVEAWLAGVTQTAEAS